LLIIAGAEYVQSNMKGIDAKTLAVPNASTSTDATQASAATRIESMADMSSKLVKAILETIRERAEYALKQL